MPWSKLPPSARPIANRRMRGSTSASVTGRRYARRASVVRMRRAHGASGPPAAGRQTKSRRRLSGSPGPVAP